MKQFYVFFFLFSLKCGKIQWILMYRAAVQVSEWKKTLYFMQILYIHTYFICNWSLQPFSQDYDLPSHTIYVVCVNFIHKWRDLQLEVDFEPHILESFSWQFNILSEFLSEICWEEAAKEIFFHISFWYLIWDTNPGFYV